MTPRKKRALWNMATCPDCHEPLAIFELHGVEIDRCLACGGTWLDAGELERIGEREGEEPGELSRVLAAAKTGKSGVRRCPRCRARLRTASVGGRGDAPAVEIDRCPRSHGFWFDRGEMETLIRAFETGEEGGVARFFSNLYRHAHQTGGKGD
jgi:Zn-finger nucleic acid-binding protein